MYSKAIQKDSLFTSAYAQRAKTHLFYYWSKQEGWKGHDSMAREDIKKGLQLNKELPELKLQNQCTLCPEYSLTMQLVSLGPL